jgi:hypothetical protein
METRMPRPRTYKEETRSQTITVRVTSGTHARLSAEAAQAGKSLAGLAEHYISQGKLHINASHQLHPVTLAELKRVSVDLRHIASATTGMLPPNADAVAGALRDLFQLLLKDEFLSQRINDLRMRTSNDSTPPSPRHEFQRVVHLRPSRPAGEDD